MVVSAPSGSRVARGSPRDYSAGVVKVVAVPLGDDEIATRRAGHVAVGVVDVAGQIAAAAVLKSAGYSAGQVTGAVALR